MSREADGSLASAWLALLSQSKKRSAVRAAQAQALTTDLKNKLELAEREATVCAERCIKACKTLQVTFRNEMWEYVKVWE